MTMATSSTGFRIGPAACYSKREIMRLFGKVKQDGYALIPLSVYFKGSRVKVKLGLCKGKKLYDKRQAAAERDAKRQIDRAMKEPALKQGEKQ